jgi:MSHA pilin protein MshA
MNAHRQTARQAGFTMVELIVVILILGILSALALPKFINMGQDARIAKMNAIYGSVRAASQVTYAAALVRNQLGATANVSNQSGTNITAVYGYPDTTKATGIAFAAGLDVTAQNADNVVLDTTTVGTMLIQGNGAGVTTCQISYTVATAAAPPAITVATSGC